jgi:3-hydroxybutyryl-CoA dehydrogenase
MRTQNVKIQPVGLIGLGLMGRGIASCLLSHGLEVIAYNRTAKRAKASVGHIEASLEELVRRKMVPRARIKNWRERFRLVASIAELAPSPFVIESVKEDLELKRQLYEQLEAAVAEDAVIASNTSSLPISVLQSGRKYPARFIGMHWGEPAQIMRYLEVIPGGQTSPRTVELTLQFGNLCGKEPTLLRRDIQGFISNRMMYAMIREACHLVESGIADIETVDRSFRNDIGYWATIAGPFRWMDLTGIPAYAAVMEGLLPTLCNRTETPKLMREMVAQGALGIGNAKGFYPYTKASARRWEKAWIDFTYDIRKLADRYDSRKI